MHSGVKSALSHSDMHTWAQESLARGLQPSRRFHFRDFDWLDEID
jgi:hypothetical protein